MITERHHLRVLVALLLRVPADSNWQGGVVDVAGGKKRVGSADGRKELANRERRDRPDSCSQCE